MLLAFKREDPSSWRMRKRHEESNDLGVSEEQTRMKSRSYQHTQNQTYQKTVVEFGQCEGR